MIELGVECATTCVIYDDEAAGAATLARITQQLNALMSALGTAMGLDQSFTQMLGYLSGTLQAELDVWVWSPLIKQYYEARALLARLYANHYDAETTSFGDFLWDRCRTVPVVFTGGCFPPPDRTGGGSQVDRPVAV